MLSGGSGKRLWPLSNKVRAKQFLKILKDEKGHNESMVQRMYRKICDVDSGANIVIAATQSQISFIQDQLGTNINLCIEPTRRDTFPAIALATAYIKDILKAGEEETIIVCPVDSFVDDEYYQVLNNISNYTVRNEANIVLMGIEPIYPSTKYGYIIPEDNLSVSNVYAFKEKPDLVHATEYVSEGALWNAGIFAFKIDYLLACLWETFGFFTYKDIMDNYEKLPCMSFDYAIVEKEKNIQVFRYSGVWKDLGTWDSVTEIMEDEVSGNVSVADCSNTHIINELQMPLIALGVNNLAIAATADGILVTDKKSCHKLKDFVDDKRPMHDKREWGEYQVLDYHLRDDGNNSLTKHIIIMPQKQICYQKHHHRCEIWTIIEGSGKLILNGKVRNVKRGDVAYIRPGILHGVQAKTEMHIIEVQIGDELTEDDIEIQDWKANICKRQIT